MLGFRALGPGEFALEQSLAYPRFRALRVPVRGKKWVCLRDLKGSIRSLGLLGIDLGVKGIYKGSFKGT